MIFRRLCQILIRTSKQTTQVSLVNIRTKIENVFNKEFANVCDWFVDDKLSIYFGEDNTRYILFSSDKNLPELNITYNNNFE